jgi:hypothetical protein
MGTLVWLYHIGILVHGWRVLQLMLHPEREKDSELEGPALPFYSLLPHGGRHRDPGGEWVDDHWGIVRVIYEPLTPIVVANVLWRLHLLQPIAAIYLIFSGLALAVKTTIMWYEGWEYWRRVLDMRHRAWAVQDMAKGGTKASAMGAFVPGGLPKNMRPEEVAEVARVISGLPADLSALVTPVNTNTDAPETAASVSSERPVPKGGEGGQSSLDFVVTTDGVGPGEEVGGA